jgi:hypothetical protein
MLPTYQALCSKQLHMCRARNCEFLAQLLLTYTLDLVLQAAEIGANFLDSLARRLEDAVQAQDR